MKTRCNKCKYEVEINNLDQGLYELYIHNIEKHNMPKKVEIKITQKYENQDDYKKTINDKKSK